MGDSQAFSFELCQSIKTVLASDDQKPESSDRTNNSIEEIRHEYTWLERESTTCLPGSTGAFEWWTFGGQTSQCDTGGGTCEGTGFTSNGYQPHDQV